MTKNFKKISLVILTALLIISAGLFVALMPKPKTALAENDEVICRITEKGSFTNVGYSTYNYDYKTVDDLKTALSNGIKNNFKELDFVTINIYADMELPEINYPGNAKLILNLNGHTVKVTGSSNYSGNIFNIYNGVIDFSGDKVTHEGSVFNVDQLKIENVTFQNIKADRLFNIIDYGFAGNVSLYNLTVKDGTFTEDGGAFYFNKAGETSYKVTFENCNFINISSDGDGGAIYVNNVVSEVKMTGCNFISCSSSYSKVGGGGAIFIGDNCSNVYFGNSESDTEKKNTFSSCSAKRYGGAIYIDGDAENCVLENMIFTSNVAKDDEWGGGAIHVYGNNNTIKNCEFYSNEGAGYGGAISADASGLSVIGCVFGCNRSSNGKDIYVRSGSDGKELINCVFYDYNSSSVQGGSFNTRNDNTENTSAMKFSNEDNYDEDGNLIKGDSYDNAILIDNANDLFAFAVNVNIDGGTYAGKHYKLTSDLTDVTFSVRNFTGYFDFNWKKVTTKYTDRLFDDKCLVPLNPDEENILGVKSQYTNVFVDYIDYSGKTEETKYLEDYTFIREGDDISTLTEGFYVVVGTVNTNKRIDIDGNVSIIIDRDAVLNANGGVVVNINDELTVYSRSKTELGTLNANGVNTSFSGIGNTVYTGVGTVNIHGVNVTATGATNAPGIAASYANGKALNIYAGVVTVQGGYGAAGIGGDYACHGGTVNIYGGVVNTTGGKRGAGIGGGGYYGSGGTTNIYGGTVTAIGGYWGAGIGGGDTGSGGTTNIYGGIVIATGGNSGAGIGGGSGSSGGTTNIYGGFVVATAGQGAVGIGHGADGSSQTVTVNEDLKAWNVVNSTTAQYITDFTTIPNIAKICISHYGALPTCTENGLKPYGYDKGSELYYDFNAKRIGNESAFNIWKSEGGNGYVAPLEHDYRTTYKWNGDECTAHYYCTYGCGVDEETETKKAEGPFRDKEPSCLTYGTDRYTVSFVSQRFEDQIHYEDINALMHIDVDGDGVCDRCKEEYVHLAVDDVRANGKTTFGVKEGKYLTVEMEFTPHAYTGEKTLGATKGYLWRFFNYQGGCTFDIGNYRLGCVKDSILTLGEKYFVSFGYKNDNGTNKMFLLVEQDGEQIFYQETVVDINAVSVGSSDIALFMSDMTLDYCKVYNNGTFIRYVVPIVDNTGEYYLLDQLNGVTYDMDGDVVVYDITYTGDYEGSYLGYKNEFVLPKCPDEGYYFVFAVDGKKWDGTTFSSDRFKVTAIKVKKYDKVDATCTEDGQKTYYKYNEIYYSDELCTQKIDDLETWLSSDGDGFIEALGHDYEITYEWNGKDCTATAICKRDNSHTATEKVMGEYVKDTDKTCENPEKGHYKATFTNEVFSEQVTEKDSVTNGDPLGHDFNNYVSNDDATCENDGTKTSKCSRCEVTDTVTDEGSKLGHDYKITYEWSGKNCTAKYSCSHGCEIGTITETVTGEFITDTDATCLNMAKGHYRASFENELFETQITEENSATNGDPLGHNFDNYVSDGNATCEHDGTKTSKCSRCEVTDTVTDEGSKLGHDYEITYEWDGTSCTATAVCKHDNSHTVTETVEAKYVKDSDATTESNEKGHYEATFDNPIFIKQTGETNSVEKPDTKLEKKGGCSGAIIVSDISVIASAILLALGVMLVIRKKKNKNV